VSSLQRRSILECRRYEVAIAAVDSLYLPTWKLQLASTLACGRQVPEKLSPCIVKAILEHVLACSTAMHMRT
jgi:hypothetical protein